MNGLDERVVVRLHRRANAARWNLSAADFAVALERSAAKLRDAGAREVEAALDALHLEDLALACACERGDEAAWEHFVREHRPALYRAAAAIAGAAGRELADSLYGELFGLRERDGARQSLFRYFHGRSSLGTWLRSVLAQRHVDSVRGQRRFDPLPEEDDGPALEARPDSRDAETERLATRVREALGAALLRLPPRDRLRLAWYYQHGMTLSQIGRLCQEHEATVSRHLTRTRKTLRADVEHELQQSGLDARTIDECFRAAAADPGDANLDDLLRDEDGARKNGVHLRSKVEEQS
jgi:RNA polymerase sigma-70 factor (ECF subfamily)